MSTSSVKWGEFKHTPMKFLRGNKKLRVNRGDGSYLIVQYHSPFVEDMANKMEETSVKVRHRCNICGRLKRVLWVVPYDASYAPGWYCYWCRRKRDILDINRAKQYGKIK